MNKLTDQEAVDKYGLDAIILVKQSMIAEASASMALLTLIQAGYYTIEEFRADMQKEIDKTQDELLYLMAQK